MSFIKPSILGIALTLLCAFSPAVALPAPTTSTAFVNFEHAPVHPLDFDAATNRLALANLPAGRVELFDTGGPGASPRPLPGGIIPVGVDPVTARFRPGTNEVWVVNKVSDSISVINIAQRAVVATIPTGDEPSDVVFAGTPTRAFVSCSMDDKVQVFDPITRANLTDISIKGQRPRALAVSADGSRVFCAIFESGNRTTVLGSGHLGGALGANFPPDSVSLPTSPHAGVNPPPNNGANFDPPINPALPYVLQTSLIVKQGNDGHWRDDTGATWTAVVSGANAADSGRVPGWGIVDNDIAIIDATTFAVSYRTGLMNIVMALAPAPTGDDVVAVGTDARNHVRFEHNLNGRFIDVVGARVNAATTTSLVANLNGENFGSSVPLPLAQRRRSMGDPRAAAFSADGSTLYVAGMGSNNLVRFSAGSLARTTPPTDVLQLPAGPSGLAIHAAADRLYVFNRFAASISTIDTAAFAELTRTPIADPTPQPIRDGRTFLYNTVFGSGTGHVSCGSCHVDARMDRLAWDLGDPAGEMKAVSSPTYNPGGNFSPLNFGAQPFHPMKGPMVTQTLQDIIGHEPHHWRGDREGLEQFNGTFTALQANDTLLTPTQMQAFEDFLASIYFPPNPYRNADNSMKWVLPLNGHRSAGRFSAVGTPMPPGNPQNGLNLYVNATRKIDANLFSCATCHALPTGGGTDRTWNGSSYVPIPRGPNGENHQAVVAVDGFQNVTMKTPQLRNMAEKIGMDMKTTESLAGFGYMHDGSIDTLTQFMTEARFLFSSDQEMSDMVAFMLSLRGSNLNFTVTNAGLTPPGTPSQDVPSGVGLTLTFAGGTAPDALTTMTTLANSATSRVDWIARATVDGQRRSWWYDRTATLFRSDRDGETLSPGALQSLASVANPVTYSLVPRAAGLRLGSDADLDGFADRTESDSGSNPFDPADQPRRLRLTIPGAADANGGATTVTLLARGDTANLQPLADVADTIWHIEVDRPGMTTATVQLEWTPADVAHIAPGDLPTLTIFKAPTLAGPWLPQTTSVDIPNKTATTSVGTFSYFAIAKSTVPVKLSTFELE